MYIRGHDWLREQQQQTRTTAAAIVHSHRNDDNAATNYATTKITTTIRNTVVNLQQDDTIKITISRALRRTNTVNFTHTIKLRDSQHKIPSGQGQWIQIELKELASYWPMAIDGQNAPNANSNTIDLVIRGTEPWMKPFIVTSNAWLTDKNRDGVESESDKTMDNASRGDDNIPNRPLTVHIEVITEEKRRRKRSTSLDCQESDREMRCCRYPLKVNFTNFGWNFVVAPTTFDAYFCNGECKVGYLEQYTHTHLTSLTTSATPCCSPTKMSPLSLLYFNLDQNLVLSTIPNMSVEKCSCS